MLNSTLQCLNKITVTLVFLSVFGVYQNLTQAQINTVSSKKICKIAIQGSLPLWDLVQAPAISEAKRRGLNESQCARLSERFSEQELRRSLAKTPTSPRGKSKPSINVKQDKKIRWLFIDNKKLHNQIKQLRATQKTLGNKKSLNALSKKYKTQKGLTDKNTLKIKNIEEISRQIRDIKNQNDTILNQIGKWQDVIPRLEKNIK